MKKKLIVLTLFIFMVASLSACSITRNTLYTVDYPEVTDIVSTYPQVFSMYIVSQIEIDSFSISDFSSDIEIETENLEITKTTDLSHLLDDSSDSYLYEVRFSVSNVQEEYHLDEITFNIDSKITTISISKSAVKVENQDYSISPISTGVSCSIQKCNLSITIRANKSVQLNSIELLYFEDSMVEDIDIFMNGDIFEPKSLFLNEELEINMIFDNYQLLNSFISIHYSVDNINYTFVTDDIRFWSPEKLIEELQNNKIELRWN